MIILNQQLINEEYDVVVVGAGIGGITAGALLASRGLSVLIVEQHYIPGGVCSSIRRHDTAMDAGAALLFGWADDHRNAHHFVMNELKEEIDIIPHEALYRMHFSGDRHVTFWKDFDRYFAELMVAFPGREDEFRGFYEESFKIYDMMTRNPSPYSPDTMPGKDTLKMLFKHPLNTLKMGKVMNQTLNKILDKYVKDPEVEGLFDLLIASCYCTKLEETPLMLAAAVLCNTHVDGAFYPAGSPQTLPNKLEKGLEKNGGQILYRQQVDEILVKDNRAYGVRLKSGQEIRAKKVVSNATIWSLYGKLIRSEHISPERLEWAQAFEPTAAAAIAYMTVKKEAIPEGTTSIEAFISDLTVMEQNNYFVYIPSVDDPSICPPDMHSISILCSAGDYNWPRPWEDRYQSEEYEQEKQKVLENSLKAIEGRFPKFRENIVSVDMASPSTTERFTCRNYGTVGGPKQALGQHLMNRLKTKTEFENLFAVGDSTVMGEGAISVTTSAVGAAGLILRELGMETFKVERPEKSYVNFVEGKPRTPTPPREEAVNSKNASRLSVECQWCEDPTCMTKCPADVDVLNFIRRIESGNVAGAARAIREKNPLGEICGILCPAEKLCESECNRLSFSEYAVRIKDLQKWTCHEAGDDGWDLSEAQPNGEKVAVIGAGPAGLSCSHYLARSGFTVDVYEKGKQPGGLINQVIPAHRVTDSSIQHELDKLAASPRIKTHYETVLGTDVSLKELSEIYHSVVLAAGLANGRTLPLDGADMEYCFDALGFLRKARAEQFTGKLSRVVVVRGGSVAVDAATTAKHLGADSVTMVCLESPDEMPCLCSEIEEMKQVGIEVHTSWGPSSISHGGSGGKLTCRKCTSVFDDSGRFQPVFDETSTQDAEFDQLIFAVGQEIDPQFSEHVHSEMSADGATEGGLSVSADADSYLLSGAENIYVGGDLLRGGSTIVQAVADGRAIAAKIADRSR